MSHRCISAARAQPYRGVPASTQPYRSVHGLDAAATLHDEATFRTRSGGGGGPDHARADDGVLPQRPEGRRRLGGAAAAIKAAQPQQEQHYAAWLASGTVNCQGYEEMASALGLSLDVASGTISYTDAFQAPSLLFELWYCRHGKTTGTTEPGLPGHVDEPSNALNEVGLQQAQDAADKLEALGLDPDLVVLSPLRGRRTPAKLFSREAVVPSG